MERLLAFLDTGSRGTAVRFLYMILAMAGISLMADSKAIIGTVLTMDMICVVVSIALAVLRHEPIALGPLNRWDEAVGYLAIHYMIRFIA